MANPLTGDFAAVVQVALRQINGLLATLHQNGADTTAPLKLLHQAHMRVGETPPRPDAGAFGDWVVEFQQARGGKSAHDLRPHLVASAPPGLSRAVTNALSVFDHVFEIPPSVVKGSARLQLSTIQISVPPGSTSEVTVQVGVRALYKPQPGTTVLPEPIHGDVHATFEIRRVVSPGGPALRIRPSADDQKIQFVPAAGAGLSIAQAAVLATEIRKAVRHGFTLMPVELPAGFPFAQFKGVGSGSHAAVALPATLSGGGPPPGSVNSISQSFIGDAGFAFAVSREAVLGLIDIDAIREAIRQRRITFTIDLLLGSLDATYRLRFSSGPTLTFQNGAIEISGRVEAETSSSWAPNGFVSFKQRVVLVLDPVTERVTLDELGEPSVDESWFIPHGRAVSIVKTEIANALAANQSAVRQTFTTAKNSLATGLRTFERTATVRYTALQITADGVIVRGDIGSAARRAAVVQFESLDGGQTLSAFESWIPGGRIERFVWSWVELPGHLPVAWGGVAHSETVTHRFVFPKPTGNLDLGRVCLRIEGTRIRPDGAIESVFAGTTCGVREPELALDVPSWWFPTALPVWQPLVLPETVLRDAVAAHVSVQSSGPSTGRGQNTLVFFPEWSSPEPFAMLAAALATMRRGKVALGVVAVLPAGAFEMRRRELDAKVERLPDPYRARLQVTEDIERGWSKTFEVTKTPAAFLVDANRECTWRSEGELSAETMAAALDTFVLPAPGARFRALRTKAEVGAPAPDVSIVDADEHETAVHRLRGRRCIFAFWQAWSAPCLEELRRLQVRQQEDPDVLIVALHAGALTENVDALRKQFGLTYRIVADAEHRAARAFGVRCWPTTVTLDADGRVEHVQVGLEPSAPRHPIG